MAGDASVEGAEQVQSLAQSIRTHADRKSLQRELYSGLNRASKGIRANMKGAIPAAVPHRGGLAAITTKGARLQTRTAGGGANPGVRIVASSKRGQLVNLNAGRLRHPVYGHGPWVQQTRGIDPGFLDTEFDKASPDVQRELLRVIEDIARRITP